VTASVLWVLHHVHVWHRSRCRLDSAWLLLLALLCQCPVGRVKAFLLLQGTKQIKQQGRVRGARLLTWGVAGEAPACKDKESVFQGSGDCCTVTGKITHAAWNGELLTGKQNSSFLPRLPATNTTTCALREAVKVQTLSMGQHKRCMVPWQGRCERVKISLACCQVHGFWEPDGIPLCLPLTFIINLAFGLSPPYFARSWASSIMPGSVKLSVS
jgi:hypothetical protein